MNESGKYDDVKTRCYFSEVSSLEDLVSHHIS